MKKWLWFRTLFICLVVSLFVLPLCAQNVTNLRVSQDPDLGYYKLYFDLSGKTGETYQISVTATNAGRKLENPPNIAGSGIGSSITAGKDYSIFWHPVLAGYPKEGWSFTLKAKPSNIVFVEGGSFMMGSSDGDSDEQPVHQVTVSSFLISKYELSVAEFRAFVNATGYTTTAERGKGAYIWTGKWEQKKDANWKNPYMTQTEDDPVVCISWYDALAYCNWLSLQEGLTPCYSISGNTKPRDWSTGNIECNWHADGYRLPTEAEWEYAARGGKHSKGYKYSGSNDINAVAWYYSNSGKKTQQVGTKSANELGIHDMSGNVWEWCWDWHGAYPNTSKTNPVGANSGKYPVLRGGSWYVNVTNCRVADRNYYDPDGSFNGSGVRVSRAIK